MDPNLLERSMEPWPHIPTPRQREIAGVILDVILPGEGAAPPASAVGLVDFIDQWLSAPYPEQRADAALVIPWLDELDRQAGQVAGNATSSSGSQIERMASASAQAPSFRRLCVLAAAGYY